MRTRMTRLLIAALVIAAAFVGWRDTATVRLLEADVPAPGLARDVTVLHVSDLHAARFGKGQTQIARLLEGQLFDAVVLNGDNVPYRQDDPEPALELLSVLQEHAPMVFVTRGNHDTDDVMAALEARGAIRVSPGDDAVPFAHDAGVVVAASALDGRGIPDGSAAVLALLHYPMTADLIAAQPLPQQATRLFLFGHTHGGQIRLPLLGALWVPSLLGPNGFTNSRHAWDNFFPELRGRTLTGMAESGGAYTHTSAGLGTQGVRLRFLCPAEMTVITLRAGS
jgi:hypothetical protein